MSIVLKSNVDKAAAQVYFRRLRDLREDADLTQTQAAEILGIRQTVYSCYERGFQTFPLEHFIRLAEFCGVTLDYLAQRDEQSKQKNEHHA